MENLNINDILIKNNYNIVENSCNDNFHIAIYYLKDNKCKVIIRRLDHHDWGQDLKISIDDMDKEDVSEKISIGSCVENLKIFEIYTKIKLYKSEYSNQLIPKVIIQTSNYNNNKNIYHYNSIMSLIELNPEYSYKIFNDDECRLFIKNNLNKISLLNNELESINILNAYDLLIPGALKADLFRYVYLYLNGGCYFDCKIIIKKPLNKIIKSDDKLLLSLNSNNMLYNGIIFIEKKNNEMLKCLDSCVSNILSKNKGHDPHSITGNELFNFYFNNNNPSFKRKGDLFYFYNEKDTNNTNYLFDYSYKDYYSNYYGSDRDFRSMWHNNKYFYNEHKLIDDYKFYFLPNIFNDKFEIFILKNNIGLVRRIDANEGWGQNLEIRVVNINESTSFNIIIGNSEQNEKIFLIE
jgi:mannosyltransferase OCH1-like enzyme